MLPIDWLARLPVAMSWVRFSACYPGFSADETKKGQPYNRKEKLFIFYRLEKKVVKIPIYRRCVTNLGVVGIAATGRRSPSLAWKMTQGCRTDIDLFTSVSVP